MATVEPPSWTEIEEVPEFQGLPYQEKEKTFARWQQDRAAFAQTIGASEQDIAEFIPASTKSFQQKYLLPEIEQAQQQTVGLAELDVAPYRTTPQDALDEQTLNDEAVTAMRLYKQRGEWEALPADQRQALERRAALGRAEKPFVETRVAPESPLTRFFGPAVTAQAQKEMNRGITDSSGAVAGGALGTQMLMGLRGGPLGVLLPVAGAIGGSILGGGVQEEATALLENNPEVTAARLQSRAQVQDSPEYKGGSLLAMGSLFRPSASVVRGALRGDAEAVGNIAIGGGLGVGTAAVQPILEGRMPTTGELLEGGALGLALHQPTRLAQGLFGFRPFQLQPNLQTDTVRTPIGTLDKTGRIVQPDTPEGVALRAIEGLKATEPTSPGPSRDAEALLEPIVANHRTEDGATDWAAVRNTLENLQPKSGANPELIGVMDEALQIARQNSPDAPVVEVEPSPIGESRPGGRMVDGVWIPDELPVAPQRTPTETVPVEESPINTRSVELSEPPTDVSGERVQPPWPTNEPVGIRNEFTEAERVRLGFPGREEPVARSFPELHAEAERAFAQNPEVGRNLVEELKVNPRAHTGPEAAVLTFETARQQKLVDKAYEAVNNARTPEQLAEAQKDLSREAARYQDALSVSELSGTQASEALYARRLIINEDFSLARMLAREQATKPDASPLTPTEMAEVGKVHDQIKAAQEGVAKVESQIADTEAERVHKQLLKEVSRGAKSAAKEQKGLVDYFNEQAEAARKRIIARRGRLQTGDPLNLAGLADEAIIGASYVAKGVRDFAQWSKQMLSEFGERVRPALQDLFARSQQIEAENSKPFRQPTPAEMVAEANGAMSPKLVFDLARAHVRGGVNEMADVMKAVHNDLLPTNPTLTERQVRDAFSGYGKTSFPSKEADLVTLRELKALARLTSQLEDAQRGVAPLKTGPQRDKQTVKVRELQKQVDAAMRKAGINPGDPATQLASAHTARVTRLKNTIEELQGNIAAGERTPQNEGVPWTPEEVALRDQVDVLRDQLDAVLGTPESDKLNSLLKRIEAVTNKLATGDINPRTGKPTVDTRAVYDAKLKLSALNRELADARRAARLKENPPKTPDEKRLAALEKRRDDLIAGKMKPGRKVGADTEEQALVSSQIDDLTSQIREAEQVVYNSPEERLARAKEASRERQRVIQARIDANDYAPPVKKDKVMDRDLMKALYQEALLKEEWQSRSADQEWSRKSVWSKAGAILSDSPNLARILITSADGPAIFRQTLTSVTTPIRTAKAAWQSMRAMFSEQKRFEFQRDIATRPNAPLYEASGLRITRPNAKASATEEQYMSRLINKLPKWTIVGPVARAAERSFTTYLNRYRADMFDAMYKLYKPGDYELPQMASVINDFTGSASLRGSKAGAAIENAAPLLNKLFFAARKTIADLRVGTLMPLIGAKGTVKSRAYALEQYARLTGTMALFLGLAKTAGLYYETDPRSTHFGKVYVPGENGKLGVWHDAFSGPTKAFTLASRAVTGQTKTAKGKIDSLTDPKYGGADVSDTVAAFMGGKLSPLLSNLKTALDRKEYDGSPVTVQSTLVKNTIPISYQNVKPILESLGIPKFAGTQAFQFLGGGAQPARVAPRKN